VPRLSTDERDWRAGCRLKFQMLDRSAQSLEGTPCTSSTYRPSTPTPTTTKRTMPSLAICARPTIGTSSLGRGDVNEVGEPMGDNRVTRVIFGGGWPHIERPPEPTDWVPGLQTLDVDSMSKILGGNASLLNDCRSPR